MEHLDARGGSLTDNPANAGLECPDQDGAELDRVLADAIRRLIAQARDTVDAASRV
jgi:hypothetical protein